MVKVMLLQRLMLYISAFISYYFLSAKSFRRNINNWEVIISVIIDFSCAIVMTENECFLSFILAANNIKPEK